MKMVRFFKLGGGTRSLVSLTLAFILVLSMTASVFAAEVGDSVSYRARHEGSSAGEGTAVFTVTYNGKTYPGTCAQVGVPFDPSGSGKINAEISASSKAGKVLYDLIVKRNFWGRETSAGSEIGVSGTGWTYAYLVECVCQISQQGSDWLDNYQSFPDVYPTAQAVWNWYRNYDVSDITVKNFEIYFVKENGGAQNFIFWDDNPTGHLKLKKASGNSLITG